MKQFLVQYIKDFKANFANYNAYFLIATYYIISFISAIYIGNYFARDNDVTLSYFVMQPTILALIIPAITMRSWGEELKTGSFELLITQPISYIKLVLAKFFASYSFFVLLVLSSIPFIVISAKLSIIDWSLILSNYIGLLLCGALFSAIGCLISIFNKNNVLCYTIAIFVILFISQFEFTNIGNISLTSLNFDVHYKSFLSGFLYLTDFIYFILGTVICIWVNVVVFYYKKTTDVKEKKLFYLFNIIVFSGFITFIVGFSFLFNKPFDFTTAKKFTLSNETVKFLSETNKRIDITLYVAKSEYENLNSGYAIYADYVERFFRLFEQSSYGAIRFETVKVEAFSPLEMRLIKENIPFKEDKLGNKIYMVADFSDNEANKYRISSFNSFRQNLLESDIMRIIYGFGSSKKNVALIVDNKILGEMTGFINLLQEFYNVNYLSEDTFFIPQIYDSVIFINPRHYSTELLLALDQYILKGGNLIMFNEPNLLKKDSTMLKFLANFGIKPIPSSIIKNTIDNFSVSIGAALSTDNFNKSGIRSVIFNEASVVDSFSIANYRVEPILTSDDKILAVHSWGKFGSFFPFDDDNLLIESEKDGALYFFSDTDIIKDYLYLSEDSMGKNFYENIYLSDNGLFLLKLLNESTNNNIEKKLKYKHYLVDAQSIGLSILSSIKEHYLEDINKNDEKLHLYEGKKNNFNRIIEEQGFASAKNIGDINNIKQAIDEIENNKNKINSLIISDYQKVTMGLTVLIIIVVPFIFLLSLIFILFITKKLKLKKIRRIISNA